MKGGRRGLKTAEIQLAESCRKQVSFESKAEGTLPERFGVKLWDFGELLTRWTKVSCWFICT